MLQEKKARVFQFQPSRMLPGEAGAHTLGRNIKDLLYDKLLFPSIISTGDATHK
jgi:hypothetical protein